MRPSRRGLEALAAAALCATGCGHGPYGVVQELRRARTTPVVRRGIGRGALLAAVDDTPSVMPRLIRPSEEPALPGRLRARSGRFGARVGYVMPTSAEKGTWDPAVCAGVYYRGGGRGVYELGIDYASLDSEYESSAAGTQLYLLRFDVLLGRRTGAGGVAGLYILGGAEVGQANATLQGAGDTGESRGGGINLGLGFGSPGGAWDARVAYSFLMGSENVAGIVTTALGFAF